MIDLGMVRPGQTIRIPFSSFDKDDGSSITMTNFAVGDILIYKDGDTAERASTAGFTATTDFDSKTGKHLAIIDLADNTTAGFFAAGSEYNVAIDAVTVDGVTVGGWIARFRIGYFNAIINTTIASLSSQTSFTLTAGPAEDDALNGMWCIIHDVASAVQIGYGQVLDYTGSTKTVTLVAGTTFTAAATDNFSLMGPMPLQPVITGNKFAVDSAGLGDANTVKLGPTGSGTAQTARDIGASVLLSSGTGTGQVKLSSGYVAPNWGDVGNPTTTVGLSGTTVGVVTLLNGLASAVITATSIASDAFTTAKFADGCLTAAKFASGAFDAVWSVTTRLLTAGTNIVLAKGTGVTGFNDLSAAQVNAEADTALADYDGPTNAELATALAAADDAVLAAIAALNNLSQANIRTAVGLASANLDTQLSTIDDFLDTEIAAIKAKTDNLPAAPAATGDIPTAAQNAAGLLDLADGVESGETVRQALRVIRAALVGKSSGFPAGGRR